MKIFAGRLLFAGLLLGLLNSCENDIKEVEAMNQKSLTVEVAHNITSLYSQRGQVKARMTAPLLYRYTSPPASVVLDSGLKVEFFNDSLQVKSVLTAKKGKYLEDKDDILVKDSVVIINDKGERLECEELHWDSKKQQFYTDKPVKVITTNNIIYGDGLTANQDFSERTIINPHGQLKVNNSQLP